LVCFVTFLQICRTSGAVTERGRWRCREVPSEAGCACGAAAISGCGASAASVINAAVTPAGWGDDFLEDHGKLDGVEGERLGDKAGWQIRRFDRAQFCQEQGDFYDQRRWEGTRDKGEIHVRHHTPAAGDR